MTNDERVVRSWSLVTARSTRGDGGFASWDPLLTRRNVGDARSLAVAASKRRRFVAVLVAFGVAANACGGSDATVLGAGGDDASGDALAHDAGTVDGAVDGTVADAALDTSTGPDDAATDGGAEAAPPDASMDAPVDSAPDAPPTVYNDISNPGNWQSIEIPPGDGGMASVGYWGAAFDGRNVYFSPDETAGGTFSGLAARVDTTTSFLNLTSWSAFDMTTVNTAAVGFAGAEFDGRYVYYVPFLRQAGPVLNGLAIRFDTQASFASGAAYDLFDTTSLNGNPAGFAGGSFDGRYVYFAPYVGTGSLVTRFDTTADFETSGSWSTFDVSAVNGGMAGYLGAVFDGRYLYFVPFGSSGETGLVVRYDTTLAFDATTSWRTFDLTTVHALAKGFNGGVFDGRYVYFIPFQSSTGGVSSRSGRIARLDTQGDFSAPSAWDTFDLTSVNANATSFCGGIFDGRYVYVIPTQRASNTQGAPVITVRLDTTAPFGSSTSWSAFDLSQVSALAFGFSGGAFDGQHVWDGPTPARAICDSTRRRARRRCRARTGGRFIEWSSDGHHMLWRSPRDRFVVGWLAHGRRTEREAGCGGRHAWPSEARA